VYKFKDSKKCLILPSFEEQNMWLEHWNTTQLQFVLVDWYCSYCSL